jgi:hypothetical protein
VLSLLAVPPTRQWPLPVPAHVALCHTTCLPAAQSLSDHDRPAIEKRVESIIKDNQRFQRVVVSRDEALGMFQENKFKVRTGGQGQGASRRQGDGLTAQHRLGRRGAHGRPAVVCIDGSPAKQAGVCDVTPDRRRGLA